MKLLSRLSPENFLKKIIEKLLNLGSYQGDSQ